jgi:hypothetical protein
VNGNYLALATRYDLVPDGVAGQHDAAMRGAIELAHNVVVILKPFDGVGQCQQGGTILAAKLTPICQLAD